MSTQQTVVIAAADAQGILIVSECGPTPTLAGASPKLGRRGPAEKKFPPREYVNPPVHRSCSGDQGLPGKKKTPEEASHARKRQAAAPPSTRFRGGGGGRRVSSKLRRVPPVPRGAGNQNRPTPPHAIETARRHFRGIAIGPSVL